MLSISQHFTSVSLDTHMIKRPNAIDSFVSSFMRIEVEAFEFSFSRASTTAAEKDLKFLELVIADFYKIETKYSYGACSQIDFR